MKDVLSTPARFTTVERHLIAETTYVQIVERRFHNDVNLEGRGLSGE